MSAIGRLGSCTVTFDLATHRNFQGCESTHSYGIGALGLALRFRIAPLCMFGAVANETKQVIGALGARVRMGLSMSTPNFSGIFRRGA